MRALLASDILNLADSVGLDAYQYATTASRVQLSSLLPGLVPASGDAPEVPAKLQQAVSLVQAAVGSSAVGRFAGDPRGILRAGGRVLQSREGRELLLNTASMMGERAVSRGIRLVFGLPQPPAKEYPHGGGGVD